MEKPRWQQLCAQAAVEQDSKKLLRLVTEINQLLDNDRAQKLAGPDSTVIDSYLENDKLCDGM